MTDEPHAVGTNEIGRLRKEVERLEGIIARYRAIPRRSIAEHLPEPHADKVLRMAKAIYAKFEDFGWLEFCLAPNGDSRSKLRWHDYLQMAEAAIKAMEQKA